MSPRSRGRRYAHLEEEPDVVISSQPSEDNSARGKSSETRVPHANSDAPTDLGGIEAHPGFGSEGASIPSNQLEESTIGVSPNDEENPDMDDLVGTADFGSIGCVICQDVIAFPIRSSLYMITPCDHLFHTTCLRPWLDHALQCPTCRLMLPPP
jgi:hypothetical protein